MSELEENIALKNDLFWIRKVLIGWHEGKIDNEKALFLIDCILNPIGLTVDDKGLAQKEIEKLIK